MKNNNLSTLLKVQQRLFKDIDSCIDTPTEESEHIYEFLSGLEGADRSLEKEYSLPPFSLHFAKDVEDLFYTSVYGLNYICTEIDLGVATFVFFDIGEENSIAIPIEENKDAYLEANHLYREMVTRLIDEGLFTLREIFL